MNFKELVEYAKENPVKAYVDNDTVSFYPNNDDDDCDPLLIIHPSEFMEEALSLLGIESIPA